MDIIFLIAVGAFWLAAVALAYACERLQSHKVAP